MGVDGIKQTLFERLRVPGRILFSAGLEQDYFAQLCSEQLVTLRQRGRRSRRTSASEKAN